MSKVLGCQYAGWARQLACFHRTHKKPKHQVNDLKYICEFAYFESISSQGSLSRPVPRRKAQFQIKFLKIEKYVKEKRPSPTPHLSLLPPLPVPLPSFIYCERTPDAHKGVPFFVISTIFVEIFNKTFYDTMIDYVQERPFFWGYYNYFKAGLNPSFHTRILHFHGAIPGANREEHVDFFLHGCLPYHFISSLISDNRPYIWPFK